MFTQTETIYVRLLDEGTEVFRAVEAEEVGELRYRISASAGYDPEDEHWEYGPGSVVRCEVQSRDGKRIMVAVADCG